MDLRTGKVEKGKAPLPVSGKLGRGPESGKEADESASFPVLCGKCNRMMVIYRSAAHCERERIPGDSAGPFSMDLGEARTWEALKNGNCPVRFGRLLPSEVIQLKS